MLLEFYVSLMQACAETAVRLLRCQGGEWLGVSRFLDLDIAGDNFLAEGGEAPKKAL